MAPVEAGTAVLGIFAHVDTIVRAIGELRRKGYRSVSAYSPVPLDEI